MTTALDRMGRAELLALIATLKSENGRLEKAHAIMLENLTSVQAVSTRLTNEARGVRHFSQHHPEFAVALHAIMGAAYAAECKHGPFSPRLTHIPDGTGGADAVAFRALAQDACSRAEQDGTVTWRQLAEEEAAELFAETDPQKIRAEAAQLGAVCAAWIQAIDERGAQ